MRAVHPGRFVRFGPFQLDLRAGELRRDGEKIKVPDQSLQLLAMLLDHPGEVVTREELQQKLWPNGTIVEFDQGINATVKRLRQALEDSATEPQFIETLPRRGYRFLAPVERAGPAEAVLPSGSAPGSGELIGQTISRYRILQKLGHGAMGVVYQAEDTRLGRTVALKFLPEELSDDPRALESFEREARAASALNHPNICTVHEVDDREGVRFIVMECVSGKSLDQVIGPAGLPMEDVLSYAIQIADALAKAHSIGIIHRDLKPSNVMVTGEGSVKLLDFGLAKVRAAHPSNDLTEPAIHTPVTGESTTRGTPPYMAPEQQGRETDARTDIFALGAVIYEMATGRQAFAGSTPTVISEAVLNRTPPPASQVNPEVPLELEKIINRALEKDPDARYQAASDLRAELNRLRRDRELVPVPAAHHSIHPLWVAAAVAVICVAGAAIWLLGTRSKTPEAVLVPVPLTSYPGDEDYPTFSPDGNQVAFHWGGPKPGAEGIYVKAIGTDQPVLVAKTEHGFPAWSPDGRLIAFLGPVPSDNCGVFLVPAVGGSVRKLVEISYQEYPGHFVAWHPGGKWLAAVDKLHPTDSCALFLVSAETGEKRKLTSPPVGSLGDHCPAFSPDGHAVVFVRNSSRDSAGRGLYILELGDDLRAISEPKRLTSDTEHSSDPAWTADGHSLVFAASVYSSSFLWRLELQSPGWRPGRLSRLAFAGEQAGAPAISRQGRLVFMRSPPVDTDIWRLELSGGRRSGKPPVKLISSTRIDDAPAYSPDGKRIAFVSNRLGNYEIWLSDSDGSNAAQLTSTGGTNSDSYTTTPRWSQDGRWIYFDSNMTGHKGAYAISADGGRPRPAADSEAGWTSASRNGRWIYFESSRSGESQIWKMPANGGSTVQVTKHGGSKPFVSPDGRFLYYSKSLNVWQDEIRKVPVDGVDETPVVVKSAHTFAAGERGIYFNSPGDDQTLRFLDFSTNKIEKIAKLENQLGGYSLSPDGRYLLYTVLAPTSGGSDLMLVENFH